MRQTIYTCLLLRYSTNWLTGRGRFTIYCTYILLRHSHDDDYIHSKLKIDKLKACSHWIRIQTGSVTEFPKANSMRIQCASIAWFASTLHCAEPNSRVHVDHTSTQLPWRPRQIFTSASHHIASRVEQICGTQCVARRSALTVGERACHALFGSHVQGTIARSSSIWIETTSGSGLGLIRIGSGLGECAFSVNALKPDSNPVQCALGVQCEQAFSVIWTICSHKQGKTNLNRNSLWLLFLLLSFLMTRACVVIFVYRDTCTCTCIHAHWKCTCKCKREYDCHKQLSRCRLL